MDLIASLRKYNIWDKDSLPEGFRREKYLSRIVKYLNNNLIKVIIGQRRSGKSYFLRQIMNYLVHNQGVERRNIFYLNKEFIEFEEIRTAQDLHQLFNQYLQQLQPEVRVYIFLDEVQNIENWEKLPMEYLGTRYIANKMVKNLVLSLANDLQDIINPEEKKEKEKKLTYK